ncbi:ribonuclease H-like domain-containing protein [Tanacetum coccineum]|uniref:Ribonuclease H-like domain-containing protein n=1 Tax=Tanacetum coccineum TaxID=301880 RepID=A0ABQ5BUP8_9ASTR
MITRSQSGIVKPIDRLTLNTFLISHIPKNPSDDLKDSQWRNVMYDEYNALVKNGTWLLVPRPARLVANGSSQQLGVDFDETFRPVVKPATIRTVLSLDVSRSSSALLQQIIDSLHNEFDMTDLGALNYFLGISANRNSTESKLGPDGVPVQDPTLYRSLAGGLQYLTFTHPDLSYAVQLYAFATTFLVGYTDANWVGCPSTRSAKAEYRGVANVVAETTWLHNLLRELHSPLLTAVITLVPFIYLPILFNINGQNTLRSTFTLSVIWLPMVREFSMYLLATSENKHATNQGTPSDEHDFPTLDTYVEKQFKEPVGVTQ